VLAWLIVFLGSHAAFAASVQLQPNEVVVVLDTSGSMGGPWDFALSTPSGTTTKKFPATDPERGAILGALILEALTRGSTDRLTVIPFAAQGVTPPKLHTDVEIRGLHYDAGGTYFRAPLQLARGILFGAPAGSGKLLLFFTDGFPSEQLRPDEMPGLAGLDKPDMQVQAVPFGIFAGDRANPHAKAFLDSSASYLSKLSDPVPYTPNDFLRGAGEMVHAFTRGYARVLGSRPETGSLVPGQVKSFSIGKYAVELLVVTASKDPGGADYRATLTGLTGGVAPRSGSNCDSYDCEKVRRHYTVFRTTLDPDRPSSWKLELQGGAPGPVEYGIILRYDLNAEVVAPPSVTAGTNLPIRARLMFQGKPFDDAAFFTKDGFKWEADVDGTAVPLTRVGGEFTGSWFAPSSKTGATITVNVVFRNDWLERRGKLETAVEGLLPLTLVPVPNPVELGNWRAERSETKRCQRIDFTGSTNADRIPLLCEAAKAPKGTTLSCTPVPGTEATLTRGGGQPLMWDVCVTAASCCGDAPSGDTAVTFRGKDPAYAASAVSVPTRFQVAKLGFLRCWWPYLAAVAGAMVLVWFVLGWVRPYSFDPSVAVRLASNEKQLRAAMAHVLRERPGGRRGFYRNARMAVSSDGSFVKARRGVILLEAAAGGCTVFKRAPGLEQRDERTGKWVALKKEDFDGGHIPRKVYRLGNLYMQWE
jgi:hypothetical protein